MRATVYGYMLLISAIGYTVARGVLGGDSPAVVICNIPDSKEALEQKLTAAKSESKPIYLVRSELVDIKLMQDEKGKDRYVVVPKSNKVQCMTEGAGE